MRPCTHHDQGTKTCFTIITCTYLTGIFGMFPFSLPFTFEHVHCMHLLQRAHSKGLQSTKGTSTQCTLTNVHVVLPVKDVAAISDSLDGDAAILRLPAPCMSANCRCSKEVCLTRAAGIVPSNLLRTRDRPSSLSRMSGTAPVRAFSWHNLGSLSRQGRSLQKRERERGTTKKLSKEKRNR